MSSRIPLFSRGIAARFAPLLAMLSLTGCGGGTSHIPVGQTPALDSAGLRRIVSSVRDTYHLPALAGAVCTTNGAPIAASVGIRKVGAAGAVTESDRFSIGSCCKSLTGTLVGMLVAEGKLSYDQTLAQLLPGMAMLDAYRGVTLQQLLEMRGGLPAYASNEEQASIPEMPGSNATEQRGAFAAFLLQQPPAAPIGSYLYSNAAYVLAGYIAERAAGESWEQLVQTRIYTPLGMTSPRIGPPMLQDPSGEPWGHVRQSDGSFQPVEESEEAGLLWAAPAGLVAMTPADWARYVQAHLRGLRGQSTGIPGLTPQIVRQLHQGPTDGITRGAWQLQPVSGVPSSIFIGSTDTFYAFVVIQPDKDRALVTVTNGVDPDASSPVNDLALAAVTQRVLD